MKKGISAELREKRASRKRRQAVFAAIPEHPAKQALRIAMLEAAFYLFEDNKLDHGDGLLEFMSETDVTELCRQFFETEDVFDPTKFASLYVFLDRPYPRGARISADHVRRVDWRKRARQSRFGARLVESGEIE